ncbi:amino acid permease [Streptomyces sp. NPDC089919]|uniref:amino acid permease n=1 Tax=Streptomyces sp. NPDC089919 TaxID=3155188 RepID=UPI0034450C70
MSRPQPFTRSFSAVAVLGGCLTMFGCGLTGGGPAVMMWGWALTGAAVLLIGMSLAEVTSAGPTSGGLYFTAQRLGGPRWGWATGWLNLLGVIGGLAAIDYGAASFITALLELERGVRTSPGTTLAVFAAVLGFHLLAHEFTGRGRGRFSRIAFWWQVLGIGAVVATLAVIPVHHQSAAFVFGYLSNGTGWSNPVHVSAVGLLLAGSTYCGFDTGAHVAEETRNARLQAPRGIVRAVWASLLAGLAVTGSLLFAVQDYDATTAAAVPAVQVFLDALGPTGAKLLLLAVVLAQLCCGSVQMSAAGRMIHTFSRDGSLPGSTRWRRLSPAGVPRAAGRLAAAGAFLLAVPLLWSRAGLGAIVAVNVIGMIPSCVIPVYLRLRMGDRFVPGPWSLGRAGRPVALAAVVSGTALAALSCLPQRHPVTLGTFNYAPVALTGVLVLAAVWWWVAGSKFSVPVVEDPQLIRIESQIV